VCVCVCVCVDMRADAYGVNKCKRRKRSIPDIRRVRLTYLIDRFRDVYIRQMTVLPFFPRTSRAGSDNLSMIDLFTVYDLLGRHVGKTHLTPPTHVCMYTGPQDPQWPGQAYRPWPWPRGGGGGGGGGGSSRRTCMCDVDAFPSSSPYVTY